MLAQDAATLVYLAGQNVVTLHTWLSRADKPHQPDRLTLDFDPSGGGFSEVRAAARAAGDRLRDLGLTPYAMTTGSRGIHVVCPLRRGPDFPDVHAFARALAEEMVADDPRHLTLEWHKAERGKRIYVDVNRIAYAQHAVAPYAVRPRAKAPVAMPIALGRAVRPGAPSRPMDDQEHRPAARRRRSVVGHDPPRSSSAQAPAAALALAPTPALPGDLPRPGQPIEHHVHDPHDQRRLDERPEAVDVKAAHDPLGDVEHQHRDEEPGDSQGEDGQWQCHEPQERLEHRVENPEDSRRRQQRPEF